MKLIRVSREGKTAKEMIVGKQNVLFIPGEYIKYRCLEKGRGLYAFTMIRNGKVLFCYSEEPPKDFYSEMRNIILHGTAQFRVNMPTYFYTALNHKAGDRYEVYHDGDGTLIYERVD